MDENYLISKFINENANTGKVRTKEEVIYLIRHDSVLNACFRMLLTDKITPFECILLMAEQNISQTKEFIKYIELNPNPHYVK